MIIMSIYQYQLDEIDIITYHENNLRFVSIS